MNQISEPSRVIVNPPRSTIVAQINPRILIISKKSRVGERIALASSLELRTVFEMKGFSVKHDVIYRKE